LGLGALLKRSRRSPLRKIALSVGLPILVAIIAFSIFHDGSIAVRSAAAQTPLHASDGHPSEYDSVTESDDSVTPEPLQVWHTTIGNGGTLTAALDRIGVPAELRPTLIRTADDHIDLRRLPSRTGISASFDASGILRRIASRVEATRFLRLTLGRGDDPSEGLRSELLRLPVRTIVESAGGYLESSVAQALSGSPHGMQLVNAFADVVQWDVDLLVDPRPGDRIRIVYETQRLAELSDDLPRFGNAPDRAGEFLRIGRVLAASYEGARVRTAGYWVEDEAGIGGYYDERGEPLRKAFLKSPLNYRRISSGFSTSRRHPVTRRVVPHHGVDFAAATGTPVVATATGRVISAGWDGPLGQAVRIKHGSSFVTVYGHLSGFARGVRPGTEVQQNQVIGYVGSTGRATGPHLHYTLIKGGRAINPLTFKNPPADPLPANQLPWLAGVQRRWTPVMAAIEIRLPDYELARGDGPDSTVLPGA